MTALPNDSRVFNAFFVTAMHELVRINNKIFFENFKISAKFSEGTTVTQWVAGIKMTGPLDRA